MGCCATIRIPEMSQAIKCELNNTEKSSSSNKPNLRDTIQNSKADAIGFTTKLSILPKDKTSVTSLMIYKALSSHFLLKSLNSDGIMRIVQEMRCSYYEPEQIIFNQSDHGYYFYMIENGCVEILVKNAPKIILQKGECFGELAMLHDSNRTGTAKALESTTLWLIDRESFRSIIKEVSSRFSVDNRAFLDNLDFFQKLGKDAKEMLLNQVACHEFSDGQIIIREGDPGNILYIIKDGKVRFSVETHTVRFLKTGEIFGEQAAVYGSARTCTVTAIGNVSLLSLGNSEILTIFTESLKELYKNTILISFESNSYLKYLNEQQSEIIIENMAVETCNIGESINPNIQLHKTILIILQGNLRYKNVLYGRSNIIGINELISGKEFPTEGCFAIDEILVYGRIHEEALEKCIGGTLHSAIARQEIMSILKTVPLLRLLPQSKLKELGLHINIMKFVDKAMIFSQNEPSDSFYIVKEGQVKIIKDENLIRYISKNDYFGERSILLDQQRTASAIAIGNCECWFLTKQDFVNIIDEEIRNQLIKRLELQNEGVQLGDLLVGKHLGQGVLGDVFLVVQKQTNLRYALKTVLRSKVSAYNVFENLIMERNIMLQIDHPLIIRLVKTFRDELRIYFLLEFIQGTDLYDALKQADILSNESAKFYCSCILMMLEYLHDRNILYRDLKPENIMVDMDGYPKLIDFGASKISIGKTNTLIGTPHYVAPEYNFHLSPFFCMR